MVVTPDDLESKFIQKERQLFTQLESYLDRYLMENYKGNDNPIKIPVGSSCQIRDPVLESLLHVYSLFGWKTKVETADNSAKYIEFTPDSKGLRRLYNQNYEEPNIDLFYDDDKK